ncbi:helix-turn-helix domain-containing protein [Paenibacillus hemerocallicola]|uniref:Helix-turn-helix domain-containing protein n=1 Tax=Paenibacillus hemerocallicola TaxID=1172614 RepID=A0A5C4T9Z7_9BACL|nr:AraC family transcriptional regulator [Paenibacillus hemerocallicola]TNJ65556.1 helix-turn-helix domain-containing protein [Paenibacillus hemerocallicola]
MEIKKKKEIFEGKRFPFKIGMQQHTPHLVRAHWHEHLEFIRIIREPVTLHIDSETFEARKGDIFFINSNQIHSATTWLNERENGNGVILGMVFDKSILFLAADNLQLRQTFSLFNGANVIRNRYSPDDPHWEELAGAMDKAYDEFTGQQPAYEFAILSCLYRMMTPLLRLHQHNPRSGDPDKHAAYYRRLKPALDYMENHYARKVYMESVCQTVNMSPYHFSSMFKKTFGIPPVQYLTRIRVDQAKRLLVDREIPVTEIAERSGFCNINYFDKVFKEQSGFTPMEYRKRFVPTS